MLRNWALCLAFSFLLMSDLWADQVFLQNGDRVTGKIVKKDAAGLLLKSDLFGAITVPWDVVVRIVTDEPLTVVLPDGKSVEGKVAVADLMLEVTTTGGKETVPQSKVGDIRNAAEQKAWERLQHPDFLSLWTGFADLGVSLTGGNAETATITASVNASRTTRTDKTSAYFHQIYSRGKQTNGDTVATAKAIRGGWSYNRNIRPLLFVDLFNDYEYDAFQDLDLRFTFGGGLGYTMAKTETTRLDLLGGGDYSREKFNTPLTRNSAEAYWGNNLTYQVSKITSLRQSFRMFNNLSEGGMYRMNFDVGTSTALRKWLAWQITFSDRYLSDPMPGRVKNDILLTTGLRFTFAK